VIDDQIGVATVSAPPELRNWLGGPAAALTVAALTVPLACLLCGRPPAFNGIFAAKNQAQVMAPPGRCRLIRYSLCKRCRRKATWPQRVEERILGDFAALARAN
jgi:hypothetical protein